MQWRKPRYLPGILTNITITVRWRYESRRPQWCNTPIDNQTVITGIPGTVTSYVFDAKPFSLYFIKLRAATGAGWGNSGEHQIFKTKPGAPGEVTDLRYVQSENSSDPNVIVSTLVWGMPCFLNGDKLEYFHVTGTGIRSGFEHHTFTRIVNQTDFCINENCTLPINDLREEHNYTVEVAAKVTDYKDLGDVSIDAFAYPAGSEYSISSFEPFAPALLNK